MGSSNTHYVYGRSSESDAWLEKPLIQNSKCLMKKFKHMVYCFGLNRRYKDCKALYLYRNRERLCKAELIQPTAGGSTRLELTFESSVVLKNFDEAEEQLIDFEHVFMERAFTNRFGAPATDEERANTFVFNTKPYKKPT